MRDPVTPDTGTLPPAGTVYLLHFSRPYFHARHYLGWSSDVGRRIRLHQAGGGSRLVRAAVADGIEIYLARTWENVTRAFERRCHRVRRHPFLCPICRGRKAWPLAPRRRPPTGLGF